MLSSVLKSKQAVEINIAIMRTFTMIRKMMLAHKDIMKNIEEMSLQISEHNNQFMVIFEYLKKFEEAKQQQLEQANRKRIGFKTRKTD